MDVREEKLVFSNFLPIAPVRRLATFAAGCHHDLSPQFTVNAPVSTAHLGNVCLMIGVYQDNMCSSDNKRELASLAARHSHSQQRDHWGGDSEPMPGKVTSITGLEAVSQWEEEDSLKHTKNISAVVLIWSLCLCCCFPSVWIKLETTASGGEKEKEPERGDRRGDLPGQLANRAINLS